jgi:phosphate transport system substrate-binding protein
MKSYAAVLKPLSLMLVAAALASCGGSKDKAESAKSMPTIKMSGSNTMAPIAGAWSENYDKASVVASGGGSGIGIKQLIDGTIDICNSSRPLKPAEIADIKTKHNKEAKEYVIGYDALAVFTNLSNPVTEISMEQLAGIYREGGAVQTWEALGAGGLTGKIEVLGRESTSGTYEYFQEAICGKNPEGKLNPFRQGISAMSSSQAIVDTLASTNTGIGYDGMAFKTPKVKWLKIARKPGDAAVEPNAADARSGKYPLARKLYLYTIGEPTGAVKEFIDWTLSAAGQKIVGDTGNVPLNDAAAH